jgi:hypothetical protein
MKKIYRKSFIAILVLTSVQLFAQLPTIEAPKPDYPAANVISLYSDEYTPMTDITVLPWGQTSILNYVKVDTGEAMQLINLQWLPIGLNNGRDVSMLQYVHIDVYSNIASPFRFGFVDWGIAGNPPTEVYTPYFNLTPGQWYSVDYPLSYFKDRDIDCKWIGAIRFGDDDGTVYSNEIYVDNIYFFEGTPKNPFIDTSVNEIKSESSFRIYPTIVTDKIIYESQEAVKEVSISNVAGQILRAFKMNGNKQELNLLNLNPGFYFVTSHFSDGKTLSKSIIKI